MGTRGVIARKTQGGFQGHYHHWDSYVSGLGQTLFDLYNGYFQKDAKRMLSTLIDEHPAGWSTINDADFTMTPGFMDRDFELPADSPLHRRPQCYCHGDRHEKGSGYITMQGDNWGTEYAYAIDAAKSVMYCYDYQYETKDWHLFAEIDLNGPAPEWGKYNV